MSSRESRVTRVSGQLTDGSRGSRVKKCDPLSSLLSTTSRFSRANRRRLPGGGRRGTGAQQHSSVVEAPARSGCNGGVGVVSRQDALDLPRQFHVGSLQVVQSVVEPLNNLQSAKPISYFTNAQQSTYMIRTNLYSAKNRENESKAPAQYD